MSPNYVADLSSRYRKVGSNSGIGPGNGLKHNRSLSFSSAAAIAPSKPGVATARTSASVRNSNPPGQEGGAAAAAPAVTSDPRAIPSVLTEVTSSRLDKISSTVVRWWSPRGSEDFRERLLRSRALGPLTDRVVVQYWCKSDPPGAAASRAPRALAAAGHGCAGKVSQSKATRRTSVYRDLSAGVTERTEVESG
jgi:hypothetical protein